MALKHVGRIKKSKNKVVVAYRTIPGDSKSCVVVNTQALSADEHDSLMVQVESQAGQSSYEFAEMMARASLPDGRNMLAAFHTTGKMMKVAVEEVEMQPDHQTTIPLNELNQMIADQKGVTIDELALQPNTPANTESKATPVASMQTADIKAPAQDSVLTDEDLAAQYRSQADSLYKEAKALRAQAEDLVPTTKKSKAKATASAAG
tara:strand:+ start:592 stop:1209 length:618 start_codon:yes stop_codon:yes gene_type:complete